MKSSLRRPVSRFRVVVVGLVVALFANVGWSQIRGPQLGYVFDQGQGILRPILGVPGASRLGDPLNLGVSLSLAEVSPKQDYALGVTQGDGKLVLVTFGQPGSVETIESAGAGARHIILSSGGKSAAILFPENQKLRILSGLPEKSQLTGEIDLRLTGPPEVWSLDDEGQFVILSVSENQGSRISLYSRATGLQSVGFFGKVSALKLSEDRKVLVADWDAQEVILIHDVSGAAQRIRIAAKEDGIHDPVAVAFSRDQKRIFVANAGSGTVADLDLGGRPSILTACQCKPTTLSPLEGNSVFRLTELSEEPLLILESTLSEDRVLFVPADSGPRASRARREAERTRTVQDRRTSHR